MQRGNKWIASAAATALATSLLTAGAAGADDDDGRRDRDRPRCTGDAEGRFQGSVAGDRCPHRRRPARSSIRRTLTGAAACPLTGLAGDTRLIGIDHRPATGVLYGVAKTSVGSTRSTLGRAWPARSPR